MIQTTEKDQMRIGKFTASGHLVRNFMGFLPFLGGIAIFDAREDAQDTFVFLARSLNFDPIEEDEPIPEYEATATEGRSGTTIQWKRIEQP
jgi:hypothetical protein